METRVQLTLLVQSACLWLALNTTQHNTEYTVPGFPYRDGETGRFPSSKKLTNVSCLILSRFDEVKIRGESDEVKRTCVCLFTGFPTEIEDRVSIECEIL